MFGNHAMAHSGSHVLEQVPTVLGVCLVRAILSFVQLLFSSEELIPAVPNELLPPPEGVASQWLSFGCTDQSSP